jgi:hypothetical protein
MHEVFPVKYKADVICIRILLFDFNTSMLEDRRRRDSMVVEFTTTGGGGARTWGAPPLKLVKI